MDMLSASSIIKAPVQITSNSLLLKPDSQSSPAETQVLDPKLDDYD